MNKTTFLPVVCCLILTLSCQKDPVFKVSNSSDIDISDFAVVVNRTEVNRYLADTTSDKIVIVKDVKGELLPSQCDDFDKDGRWDELAFLCNLKAGEVIKIFFEQVDSQPSFPVRTNIRFGRMTKPFADVTGDLRMKTNDTKFTAPVYQMEGPAWENDMVAFRNYYDARNGIDIFGKRTTDMALDSVGVNGREYHTLADWGMDILKVGNSLGAGALAIGIGDSLYRVGPCEEGKYRLVTEGPVRAILELTYKNVPAGGRFYNITHLIAIYAGDRFYRSKVWIDNAIGDEKLVTGIVNLHNIEADTLSEGNTKILYSLGNQGFSGETLGMALLIPENQLVRYREAPDSGNGIVNTHLAELKTNIDEPSEFCFFTAWETREPLVKDTAFFEGLLKQAALRIKK
jgi:hypothetical protein